MDSKAIIDFLLIIQPFFLWYYATISVVYTYLTVAGSIKVFSRRRELEEDDTFPVLNSGSLPEITFVIPAYNEGALILKTVENTLHLNYRYKKIVVINDGSTDDTLKHLIEGYDFVPVPKIYDQVLPTAPVKQVYRSKKFPEIILIDKENVNSKSDAVNTGINICTTDYFVVLDGDTFIDDRDFESLVRPILTNPKTVAVGASVRIDNGCTIEYNRIETKKFPRNFLSAMQGVEYLRAFLSRSGWDTINGNFLVSGAFGVFPRELILEIGGYSRNKGEDLEMVMRIQRYMTECRKKYRIFYLPDPVAWTTCPEDWKTLGKQRKHWGSGVFEACWFHKKMFLNPKFGFKGLFIFPYWVLGEALEPIVELFGYLFIIFGAYHGILQWPLLVYYLLLGFGLLFSLSLIAIFTEEMTFKRYSSPRTIFYLFFSCIAESFGYHQVNLYWRIVGFFQFMFAYKRVHKESSRINKIVKAAVKRSKRPPKAS